MNERNRQMLSTLPAVLRDAWSIHTSSLWTMENQACGQCSVTALVVQDLLGGEIYKTLTDGGWHFYNQIEGRRFDFTESQFVNPISYGDVPSSREEAFMDTTEIQVQTLKTRVLARLEIMEKEKGTRP